MVYFLIPNGFHNFHNSWMVYNKSVLVVEACQNNTTLITIGNISSYKNKKIKNTKNSCENIVFLKLLLW